MTAALLVEVSLLAALALLAAYAPLRRRPARDR